MILPRQLDLPLGDTVQRVKALDVHYGESLRFGRDEGSKLFVGICNEMGVARWWRQIIYVTYEEAQELINLGIVRTK